MVERAHEDVELDAYNARLRALAAQPVRSGARRVPDERSLRAAQGTSGMAPDRGVVR
jgi:hypothetical protein